MIQMFDNKWLSIDEASKLTGYTGGYLRRMLRNKELHGQQVNARMWMIHIDEARKLASKPHTNGRPRAKEPQIIEKKAKLKKS